METDVRATAPRYFWDTWADTVPVGNLYVVFLLLSLADLVATVRQVQATVITEGNPLALWALHVGGAVGITAYKVCLVGVILGALAVVDRTRPRLARVVLLAACILMGIIALRQLGIMSVFALLRH